MLEPHGIVPMRSARCKDECLSNGRALSLPSPESEADGSEGLGARKLGATVSHACVRLETRAVYMEKKKVTWDEKSTVAIALERTVLFLVGLWVFGGCWGGCFALLGPWFLVGPFFLKDGLRGTKPRKPPHHPGSTFCSTILQLPVSKMTSKEHIFVSQQLPLTKIMSNKLFES